MRTTRFDTRSSEWIGDMTVWMRENAEDNALQLERMKRNLRIAREKELTPRQRCMLELYYDQQMSVTEIAQELRVNVSTVSRTLQRARNRLRRYLQYSF
jgi:RNA polymerase sigma factor (sigma-70 family)